MTTQWMTWLTLIGLATGCADDREPTEADLEALDLDAAKADSLKAPTPMGELELDAEPIVADFVPITDGFHEWTFEVTRESYVRFQMEELEEPTAASRRELGSFLYLRVIDPDGDWRSAYGVSSPAEGDPLDDHPLVGAARLFYGKYDLKPGTYRVIATTQRNLKAAWSGSRPKSKASYMIFVTSRPS